MSPALSSVANDHSNDTIEIDTDGPVTEELPLSDLTHDAASTHQSTRYKYYVVNQKRSALLLALLVALAAIIGISVGASNNAARNKGSTAPIQKQDLKQQPMKGQQKPKQQPAPKDEPKEVGEAEAPKAAPVKPPKKAANVATPYPTEEGTFTVSTEVSAPPTVGNRIESPTWRG